MVKSKSQVLRYCTIKTNTRRATYDKVFIHYVCIFINLINKTLELHNISFLFLRKK